MTGAELHSIRERLGLTQVQLAEELGTNQATISRWERGEIAMRRESLIVKVLGLLLQQRGLSQPPPLPR